MLRLDRFLTLALFGPLAGLGHNKGHRIPILMYHSISHDVEQGIHPYYRVVTTPEVFNQHMTLLADQGYQVIGLDSAVKLLRQDNGVQQRIPNRPVIITFDDGFLDFYTDAFPILERHGFTATVFLPTSFVNAVDRTIMGKPFLSWSQVSELNNAGITFGSHTVTHKYLWRLSHTDVEQELRESKTTIEQRIGKPVRFFSYPYAFPEHDKDFVAFMRDALQANDYIGAVTTSIGTAEQGDDPFSLKRIPVNTDDDLSLLQAKMSGGYNWMHAAQYTTKSARAMFGLRRRKSIAKWTSP